MMEEEDNYLFAYLDKDIEDAKEDIKNGKGLSQKGATAMLLKGMYNHIAHLDVELSDIRKNMVTLVTFENFKNSIDSKLNWFMALITLLVCIILPIILEFIKR